jgi:hypothetical protein
MRPLFYHLHPRLQSNWMLARLPGAYPTLDDMERHFDNYADLLAGVRRYGRLVTFDLALDASEDSEQEFRRARHYGRPLG